MYIFTFLKKKVMKLIFKKLLWTFYDSECVLLTCIAFTCQVGEFKVIACLVIWKVLTTKLPRTDALLLLVCLRRWHCNIYHPPQNKMTLQQNYLWHYVPSIDIPSNFPKSGDKDPYEIHMRCPWHISILTSHLQYRCWNWIWLKYFPASKISLILER